jgi:hypothetical protein
MTTLVERLRRIASYCRNEDVSVVMGAADEIERLRGELHSVHAHMNHLRVMYSDCIKDLRETSE